MNLDTKYCRKGTVRTEGYRGVINKYTIPIEALKILTAKQGAQIKPLLMYNGGTARSSCGLDQRTMWK